jgi:transposase
MPIPLKVREAVLQARDEGLSYAETADLWGIGYASVNRILRLERETKSIEPRPRGGGNVSPIHGPIADLLVKLVGEMPDATVAELTAVLADRAEITTSRSGVQRALLRLGFSRKKRHSSPASATRQSIASGEKRSANF